MHAGGIQTEPSGRCAKMVSLTRPLAGSLWLRVQRAFMFPIVFAQGVAGSVRRINTYSCQLLVHKRFCCLFYFILFVQSLLVVLFFFNSTRGSWIFDTRRGMTSISTSSSRRCLEVLCTSTFAGDRTVISRQALQQCFYHKRLVSHVLLRSYFYEYITAPTGH